MKRTQVPKATTLLILLLGFAVLPASAQQAITLPAALDSLYKNNISLRNSQLRAAYTRQLSETATTIEPIQVEAEYGKFNSELADNRISVSQGFQFPAVYGRQKDQFLEEWKASLLEASLNKAELSKVTTQVFYDLVLLEQIEQLYAEADSSYRRLKQLATLRLNAGESNLLEKASAESQLMQVRVRKRNLQVQKSLLQQQLAFLLHSDWLLMPVAEELIVAPSFSDTTLWEGHPLIQLQEQQEEIARAATRLEQSKLLPDFQIGYNSSTQRDDIRFGGNDRFQSVQLGLRIPFLGNSQRNKIRSARSYEALQQSETEEVKNQISSRIRSTYRQYRQQLSLLKDLEQEGLKSAKEITSTLNKQLEFGDINYLEWTLLNNEAIATRESYFNALQELNRTIIELNYLLAQP